MTESEVHTVSELLSASAQGVGDRPVYVVTRDGLLEVVAIRHTAGALYIRAIPGQTDEGGAG